MKEFRINVRTTEAIKRDVEIVAELRGTTLSSLVNQWARAAIREERERDPQAFESAPKAKAPVIARISPAKQTKADIRRQVIGDDVDDLGTVDYTDQLARTAERVRLSLLKADASPDDAEEFLRAFQEATEEAEQRIAKKQKARKTAKN